MQKLACQKLLVLVWTCNRNIPVHIIRKFIAEVHQEEHVDLMVSQ